MFGIKNYSSFIVVILMFQMIPGAGTVTILRASARSGCGMGMRAVLGTLAGDLIYMLCAVFGLAAVLGACRNILAVAQWCGAAYLCYFGWKLLRSPATEHPPDAASYPIGKSYFWQALAVSLANPKVIMFFTAFFPLFLSPGSKPLTLFILMLHVTAISLLYQAGLVLAGNSLARRFSNWRFAGLLANRLAGAGFIGFGIKLAIGKGFRAG